MPCLDGDGMWKEVGLLKKHSRITAYFYNNKACIHCNDKQRRRKGVEKEK